MMSTSKPTPAFLATLAAILGIGLALTPAAFAVPANYEGISADGKVAFFTTTDKLVSGDTDSRRDVYMRSFDPVVGGYVTREISTGPVGGNDAFDAFFSRASANGRQVFFSTDERLVSADTDQAVDVYLRDLAKGVTVLVSQGKAGCAPACGNGAADASFKDASADGAAAFFSTDERLVATDTDSAADIYRRDLDAGTTALVSAGEASCMPCGNGDETATMRGLSGDGLTAFFATFESLADADTDTAIDIYARDLPDGPTTLVSEGDAGCEPCGNDGSADVLFVSSSQDGTVAFFETKEGLVPGDADGGNDVYRRAVGTTTLVTDGTAAQKPANFAAASTDGSTVFFVTDEPLAGGGDTNGATDVYRWQGGAPSLVTSGTCCGSTFGAATADGTKVVFTTTEKLDATADTDGSADVYEQEIGGGAPALVSRGATACEPSCGNDAAAAIFNGISGDASRVFFSSVEGLASDDGDANADIYVRDLDDSTTTMASAEGVFCPTTPGGCDAIFRAASSDGARVFFQTTERLTEGDGDSELDVYEWDATQTQLHTRLVSTGNSVELGPSTPVLTGTSPASPGESTTPAIIGQADPDTSIKLYATPDCSGEVVATGTAAQLGGGGISTTVATGSTMSFRVTATDESGDTSACSNAVTYKQESAPPPPPPPPPGEGPGDGDSGSGSGGAGSGSGGTKKAGSKPGVVYVTPQTRITFAPAGKTLARRPVFRFTDATGQKGTSFRCKVDRERWRGCGSPTKLKKLKVGRHVFQVKAVNEVGVVEPAPQRRKFKVVAR
jgi:Tol biopolymer transport system component